MEEPRLIGDQSSMHFIRFSRIVRVGLGKFDEASGASPLISTAYISDSNFATERIVTYWEGSPSVLSGFAVRSTTNTDAELHVNDTNVEIKEMNPTIT